MLSFIVQCRLGSSRLPGKILLPFSGSRSILDIILDRLKGFSDDAFLVVATSQDPRNDLLEEICTSKGIPCFRGSENDVLDRFISAAQHYGADRIIRVCSDNPFLDRMSIRKLIDASRQSDADYISFDVQGTPSIRTHYGFWTEYTTLSALRKVRSMTDEPLYHEHVTNYIYANPQVFSLEWIPVDEAIASHDGVRLTIDTEEDFLLAQGVYEALGENATIQEILEFLDHHPEMREKMKSEIKKNSK